MSKSSKRNGIGLMAVLFVVFLVLKLTGTGAVASWSWWWVTAPLWIPSAIWIVIMGITAIILVALAFLVGKR